jgi:hypothetical protein
MTGLGCCRVGEVLTALTAVDELRFGSILTLFTVGLRAVAAALRHGVTVLGDESLTSSTDLELGTTVTAFHHDWLYTIGTALFTAGVTTDGIRPITLPVLILVIYREAELFVTVAAHDVGIFGSIRFSLSRSWLSCYRMRGFIVSNLLIETADLFSKGINTVAGCSIFDTHGVEFIEFCSGVHKKLIDSKRHVERIERLKRVDRRKRGTIWMGLWPFKFSKKIFCWFFEIENTKRNLIFVD